MEPILLIALYFIVCVEGLKIINMSVPLVADTRNSMELYCRFDMGNDVLYAVKWYKDDHEFFRYNPYQQPLKQTFHVPGIHLVTDNWDCSLSHCRLVLSGLSRSHSSGAYRCEISSEAPTFRLASETKNITVATLPKGNPKIEGLRDYYSEGSLIKVNCSSHSSDPAPVLTWYIDNVEASMFTTNSSVFGPDEDGLFSRSVLLTLQAERKHSIEENTIDLKCVSTLPGILLPPWETGGRIRVRSSELEMIKNQKLNWYDSSAHMPIYCCTSSLFLFMFVVVIFYR